MPVIDIILLIIFIAAAVMGYRKGFIAQAGAVAAIVVSVIACRMLGPSVTDWIMAGHDSPESSMSRFMASAISYAGIYLIAYYAIILIVKLLKLVTHTLFLGPLDRIGGAIVNILKWGLALSLVFNLYLALWPDGKLLSSSTIAGGKPIEWVVGLAPKALGLISHSSHSDSSTLVDSIQATSTSES